MDVPKESGVTKNVDCGLFVQDNIQHGDEAIVLMEGFGTLSTGDTPINLSWCDESGIQVTYG